MKRTLLALIFSVIFACGAAMAQQSSGLIGTKLPDIARFEVVQTPSDPSVIFRLDKYTGQIHRLTTCQKDDSTLSERCWKEMTVVNATKSFSTAGPRFQIAFINTQSQKITLLLNLETGQAWEYGLDKVNDKWFPFMECDERSINCKWKPS